MINQITDVQHNNIINSNERPIHGKSTTVDTPEKLTPAWSGAEASLGVGPEGSDELVDAAGTGTSSSLTPETGMPRGNLK